MSRSSVEGAIASILWRCYETSLPDTPFRMGTLIASQMRKEGYLASNDDPSKVEGRESLCDVAIFSTR
jgi:hypothetical protein